MAVDSGCIEGVMTTLNILPKQEASVAVQYSPSTEYICVVIAEFLN